LGHTLDDFKVLKSELNNLNLSSLHFSSGNLQYPLDSIKNAATIEKNNISEIFQTILQWSSKTNEQLKVDTDSIQKYIDKINDVGKDAAKNQLDEIMANASSQAKLYVQQTDAAALSTEAFAQSQTVLAKTSNAVVGGLKSIGAGLLSMGVTLAVSAALNAVVKAIYNAATAEKRYREAALDSTTAVNEKTQALDDYEAQIKGLKTSLDEGNLSENDAYEARKKLISIQDELAEKYGNELNGIDLVNGGLEEQIGLLDEAAKKKENAFLTEKDKDAGTDNKEAIEDAQRKMTQRHVYMGTFGSLSENDFNTIKKYAEDNGLGVNYSQGFSGDYSIKVSFTGDASNAEKVYTDFVNDVTNDSRLDDDTKTVIADKARSFISSAQDITTENEQLAEQAARYQIETTSAYNELYENLKKAQDDYNEAVAKDNDTAIKKALEAKTSAVEAIREAKFNVGYNDYNTELSDYNNDYIKQYMNAQADELESSTKLKAAQIGLNAAIKDGSSALTDYLDITKEDAKNTIDTIKFSVQSLNGLDDLDLVDIGSLENAGTEITAYTKEQVQAYDNMKSAADKLGISMSDLIDILVKAGLVTGESIKYTNEFTTNALSAATNATKAISLVTAAIQSQSTTAGVSSDSYSELIKEQGEYAAALDFENGYVKLNTDMAKKITQAKIDEAEANIKLAYSQNQMKYSQVKADLEALNTAVQQNGKLEGENADQVEKARSELEAQSKQLRENCRNLQMQYSLLVQNSGAYQDWVNAQNASEAGDMYDSIINAKKAIAEGLKNGKIGTEKFKAAVELTIPEDYQGDIANYMKRLNRYFKQASDGSADASGLNNFLKDSIKAGLMSKDAKDQITIAANKTTKDFADALHLSMEDVQSIWGELQEYGWEFDWGSLLGNPVDNLRMQIDDIQDQMDALGEDAESNPVWQALNEQLTDLQEKLKETFTGMDSSEINQTIDEIIEEAKKANGQLTDSQADALYEMGRVQNMYDLKEAQDKLTEAQKEYNAAVKENEQSDGEYKDMSGVATELQNAQDQVTKLTQAKEKLGEPTPIEIQTFAVKYAAGEIDGIQHDAKETTEMLANIGCSVDTTQAQSEIETQNQMADEFRNKFDNVPVTLDTSTCETKISTVSKALDGLKKDIPVTLNFGIKGTLITGIADGLRYSKGGGSSKTKGTGHAAGTPNAPGGKTLVGEIGNELVVNPHTGKWYTVGDNGAEFVNLPHGAIVFDHEKTQRLLKNGFVGGYGDALVSGNAMDAGSPGVGSFVGTAGNNYMPGKNPMVKSTYKATKASTKATKDNSKALEENKKALEKQKTALEKQKTALEKESNKLKIYGQAAIDEIEKREKALNKEKEAQDKAFEAEIEALNKKKTALQKANDEEDRAIKLAELKDALEKAKANRTVRIYNKNQGFIWAADQEAVNEAQTNLDEQQRDWRNEDILQAVDDEIDKINELKDAYDKSIEAQIEDLDNMKEKWNEVISLIGTSWEDYQLGLAAAAHFNDMTLDDMAGDLVGYKDDVLANMKEIGGVTDQIDSITESIEKLEEAISDAKEAASSGGSSGGSDSSASFGAGDGSDVETDSDLSQDTQDMLDKLEELREVYSGLGKDTDNLSEKQRGLVDTIANLTDGTKAHFNAVDELGTVQQTTADKQALMRDILSEYMTTLSQCTDLTGEQRAELTQAMNDIVNSYSGGYDTIDELIQGYNDTLIESGDMTNESYQQQLENLLEFADQNQASYDTIAEILNSNFEAVAENTDLTYGQRQSQITSLVDLANQYGISSDDIINHLANIATQEQYAAESTDITHAAMMTTVQMTCVEMGASYDSLRTKIESVTQAQQKMIEAIGKADFNTLMPMGTATSHGNKIQWGTPNFDPLQHATGVLNSPTTHIAITDEKGPEIKMRKPGFGQYSLIEKGSSVIPAQPSANLWKFGLDPESFIASHMSQRSIKSVEITQPNMSSAPVVNVGDIQMYGVNDVESFGRVIHDRVSGIFAQEFSRR
jgi:DNA repair exonuclease SbcCD ATPase subunit